MISSKNLILLSLLTAPLVLSACQEPFPKNGTITREKPPEPNVPPPLVLDLRKTVMNFEEGKEDEFTFKAQVDEPGTPVVSVDGLPDGAEFDPETLTLKWSPGFEAANDPADAEVINRSYPIRVSLYSTEDPTSVVTRNATLLVRDIARDIRIVPETTESLVEDESYEQMVEVISEDFQDIEVDLVSRDLPQGALITRLDKQKFKISYTPSLEIVNKNHRRDGKGYYRDLPFHLTVIAPRGRKATGQFNWNIRDTRKAPAVSTPSGIADASYVSFTVTAEDLNREERPKFFITKRPDFGQVETRNINNNLNSKNVAVTQVKFFDFPKEKIGTETTIGIRYCVRTSQTRSGKCTQRDVKVKIASISHPAPIVRRRSWPVGELKEMNRGKTLEVSVPVVDAETLDVITTVEVINKKPDLADVSWENGKLTIITKEKEGLLQFYLKATSDYGVITSEALVIKIQDPHPAPSINREQLPFGEIEEMRRQRSQDIPLEILDLETRESITDVKIVLSSEEFATVTWADGVLKIETKKKKGTLQFNVIATSTHGVTTVESFLLRVK